MSYALLSKYLKRTFQKKLHEVRSWYEVLIEHPPIGPEFCL